MHPRVLLLLVVTLVLSPAASAAAPTVGDFVVRIAHASGLPSAGAEEASAALESRGVVLPALAPSKHLTEGDVVAIGRSLGLSLRTVRPDAAFGEAQMVRFLQAFSGALPASGDGGVAPRSAEDPGPYPRPDGAADPLSKGKGKKKGLNPSPSDPVY